MDNLKSEVISLVHSIPEDVKSNRVLPGLQTHEAETRFLVPQKKDFRPQYYNIYKHRVSQIRPSFITGIQKLLVHGGFPNIRVCQRIVDLHHGGSGVIIGVLYKDMVKKPSALDQYDNDGVTAFEDSYTKNYTGEDDSLQLEDEHGKVQLVFTGKVPINNSQEFVNVVDMCTGCVCGVLGEFNELGELVVQRVFFPSLCIPSDTRVDTEDTKDDLETDEYIACISDLGLGGDRYDPIALDLFCSYLEGGLDVNNTVKKITQVLVCGNTLNDNAFIKANSAIVASKQEETVLNLLQSREQPSQTELDLLFTRIAATCNLIVVPGMQDPTNYIIPQQPFHQLVVPSASTFRSFKSVSNPAYIQAHDQSILVTDGHNIVDIVRFTHLNQMQAQLLTLNSRIIAPTAPDTYNCYPYDNVDPFFLDQLPNIYIVGSQPKYQAQTVTIQDTLNNNLQTHEILCINVPSFTKTKEIVIINSRTRSTQTIAFMGM